MSESFFLSSTENERKNIQQRERDVFKREINKKIIKKTPFFH